MKRCAAALALAVATMGAHADWNYTKWGMTLDEVLAASQGKATAKDGFRSSVYAQKAVAAYEAGPFKFDVKFFFDSKTQRLVSVEMKLQDSKRLSDSLADSLLAKYGQPFFDTSPNRRDMMLHHRKWRGDGNVVRLVQAMSDEDVTLIYEPLVSSDGL